MALSNHERIGKGLELLKSGIAPFVEREVFNKFRPDEAHAVIAEFTSSDRMLAGKKIGAWDVAALLNFLWTHWNEVFSRTLGNAERSLVSELRDFRNRWAHQSTFSSDDAYRALDSAGVFLLQYLHQKLKRSKDENELLRIRFDEQVRNENEKYSSTMKAL